METPKIETLPKDQKTIVYVEGVIDNKKLDHPRRRELEAMVASEESERGYTPIVIFFDFLYMEHHPYKKDLDIRAQKIKQIYLKGDWLFPEEGTTVGEFIDSLSGNYTYTSNANSYLFSKNTDSDFWYSYVTDEIFRGLPEDEVKKFPFKGINILPVGVDMDTVKSKFNYALLQDQLKYCKGHKEVEEAVKKCMEVFTVPFIEIANLKRLEAYVPISSATDLHYSIWNYPNLTREERKSIQSPLSAAIAATTSAAQSVASWSIESDVDKENRNTVSAVSATRAIMWAASSAEESRTLDSVYSAKEVVENYYMFLRDTLLNLIK